jgi:hypothetical protein
VKVRKPKKCKQCKDTFQPTQPLQGVCGWECARDKVAADKAKKADKEHRTAKRVFKDNDRTHQVKLAQKAFNAFIRLRDGKTCISCKRDQEGKVIDAGHYRTTKSLRFNEDNCHSQCRHCNSFLSGNLLGYKKGLTKKIGEARVTALENDNEPRKYTLEEIVEIKKKYQEKVKGLLLITNM